MEVLSYATMGAGCHLPLDSFCGLLADRGRVWKRNALISDLSSSAVLFLGPFLDSFRSRVQTAYSGGRDKKKERSKQQEPIEYGVHRIHQARFCLLSLSPALSLLLPFFIVSRVRGGCCTYLYRRVHPDLADREPGMILLRECVARSLPSILLNSRVQEKVRIFRVFLGFLPRLANQQARSSFRLN